MTGEAVVQKVFQLTGSKKATVAGCRVKQGAMTRKGTKYRVIRDGQVTHEGRLTKKFSLSSKIQCTKSSAFTRQ